MFAKLYDSENFGQILVKIDTHDDKGNPEVRFFIQPAEMGVCSHALEFEASEEGWDAAVEVFNSITLEKAEEIVNVAFCGIVPSFT